MSKLNQKCSKCRVPLPDKFSRQRPYLCSNCEILEEQKKHNKFIQDDLRETQRLQRQNAVRQRRQQEQEDAQYLAEQDYIQRQQDEEQARVAAEQARVAAEQEAQRVERLKQNLEVHKKHLETLPGTRTYDCFHCKNKNVMIEHLNLTASTYLYDQQICYTPPYCQFCGSAQYAT